MENVKNPYQVYVDEIMPRKLELNMKYIKERTFKTDIKLIIKTVYRVIADMYIKK